MKIPFLSKTEPTVDDKLSGSPDNKAKVRKMIEDLQKYQTSKRQLDQKIVENEKWYMSRHWELVRKKDQDAPDPVSAYLFNTIANKHADIMDNYPAPNVFGREKQDEAESIMLTSVIPCIFDNIEYRDTYSDAGWEKLKHGFSVFSVLWDTSLENGLGDIAVNLVDPLNIYWQPGIRKIKQSKRVFALDLVDKEHIEEQYPDLDAKKIEGKQIIKIARYSIDENIDITHKILIVDCYYKAKNANGKTVIHLCKFIDENTILFMSEDDPQYQESGYYQHGSQPFEIDVLFPEKESPVGFGFIDILKSPQIYIDKLDELISVNAFKSGKIRHFMKEGTVVDPADVQDYSKEVILCSTVPDDEHIKSFQVKPLQSFIPHHRQFKISELKDISGQNEFNRGEGGMGVTAASAIMALQEAGNKLSRDMNDSSYRRQSAIAYLVIELIRQFYDEERKFRITGVNNDLEYVSYSNANIKEQPIQIPGTEVSGMYRKPVFDIKIEPEKKSPFSQAAHNEIAKEMFSMGLFNPEQAEPALICLTMMQFEGKEKVMKQIKDNSALLQALKQIKAQMDAAQRENYKLRAIVQSYTGQDMGVDMEGLQQAQAQKQPVPEGMSFNG